MKEIWKPVPNYEGYYEISNYGNVKSLNYRHTGKEQLLKPVKNKIGYLLVFLYKNGKCTPFYIHRLVYETFKGEIPQKYQVNHISKYKNDNHLLNLNLMTSKENVEYSEAKAVLCFDKKRNFIKEFKSLTEASEWLKKAPSHICDCLKGRCKSAYGYVWKYKEKPELN